MLANLRRGWQRSRPGELLLSLWTARLARRYAPDLTAVRAVCAFIGHGRSSHSLVAALLDAHPRAVVADELDLIRLVDRGFSRAQLFAYCIESARRHAAAGRRKGQRSGPAYSYAVPGQWQGRYERIEVIGEAGLLTARVQADPALRDRFERLVAAPVQYVQVVRNPFDAITRLHLLTGRPLEQVGMHYFRVCERVAQFRRREPAPAVFTVRNEQLIAVPHETLTALCAAFGLDCPADYLEACAGIIFRSPNRLRDKVAWSPPEIARVEQAIERYDFLTGYSFA